MGDKSLLLCDHIAVTDKIKIHIPSVQEVLEDEGEYYSIVNDFIATPFSLMVQLDDAGIDFTTINDYQLFLLRARAIFSRDISILFGDSFANLYNILSDPNYPEEIVQDAFKLVERQEDGEVCIYDKADDIFVDEGIFTKIADSIREINLMERDNRKPGNEAAAKYLIDKNRRYLLRHKNDKREPYLETLVVACVNRPEFKYNYEETMSLSTFAFNKSVRQIKHTLDYNNMMIGIYTGSVDTSKITDKSVLSFIKN